MSSKFFLIAASLLIAALSVGGCASTYVVAHNFSVAAPQKNTIVEVRFGGGGGVAVNCQKVGPAGRPFSDTERQDCNAQATVLMKHLHSMLPAGIVASAASHGTAGNPAVLTLTPELVSAFAFGGGSRHVVMQARLSSRANGEVFWIETVEDDEGTLDDLHGSDVRAEKQTLRLQETLVGELVKAGFI
jgi:hypothetical protein